jgi:2,3-bisphosphoglycerate-dependent phosphoglycerate mutase
MRHGQSVWNKLNLFTGWVDIPLSEAGVKESIDGGKKIQNLPIDVVYTSTLVRAQMTVGLSLLHHASGKVPVFQHSDEKSKIYSEKALVLPVYTAWELNERRYGKLQGLNKAETAEKFGAAQVQEWRRSYDTVPPDGESLEMTVERTIPYFNQKIVPHLAKGEHVFVVAHGNSLRGVIMHIEGLSKEEVVGLEIATGAPIIYSYDRGKWKKES